jgi:hypothetical protein
MLHSKLAGIILLLILIVSMDTFLTKHYTHKYIEYGLISFILIIQLSALQLVGIDCSKRKTHVKNKSSKLNFHGL